MHHQRCRPHAPRLSPEAATFAQRGFLPDGDARSLSRNVPRRAGHESDAIRYAQTFKQHAQHFV